MTQPFIPRIMTTHAEEDQVIAPEWTQCLICGEDFRPKQVARLACGCTYCKGCLESMFSEALGDPTAKQVKSSHAVPRCCQGLIPFEHVRRYLSKKLARTYGARRLELEAKDRTYCNAKTCGRFVASHSIHNGQAFCRKCRAVTCSKCKDAWHFGPCSIGELESTLELANRHDWKRCPECKSMVSREDGCDNML